MTDGINEEMEEALIGTVVEERDASRDKLSDAGIPVIDGAQEKPDEKPAAYRHRVAKPELWEDLFQIGVDVLADDNMGRMIVGVRYEGEVDWYWQWGQERYSAMYAKVENGAAPPMSWEALHCFVASYAWIDRKFRNALSVPCWILHPDAVELVVMLYLGRKSYEEHRVTAGVGAVGEHLEFLNLRDRVADEIVEVLHQCEIKEGPYYGESEVGELWVLHRGDRFLCAHSGSLNI